MSQESTQKQKKFLQSYFEGQQNTINISYTVLSRQSTIMGTFEDLFRLFLSAMAELFLFGIGDEQKEVGKGDILDELDDEVVFYNCLYLKRCLVNAGHI